MFADDTKVYRNIKTHIDREVLQSDLSRLKDWSRKWQLRFNADKCKVLHIGRDNEHYEYYMDRDTKIGVTTNERDLGVQIDPDLKFNQHVDTVTSKANRMLGMIRRAYKYKDGGTIKKLYTSLIKPIYVLEYGNAAWVPSLKRECSTADRECGEKSYKYGPRTSKPRIHRQTETNEIAEHVLPCRRAT